MANRERLLAVADAIEANSEHFDMEFVFSVPEPEAQAFWTEAQSDEVRAAKIIDLNACGTTACIAGWAFYLYEDEIDPQASDELSWEEIGADLLGLERDVAKDLFWELELTADEAVVQLRELAEA